MARPVSICDEQLLAAARQLFLEKGIRATSAEVAERAGVSEGSIFKRFPSKERLFHAAMRVDVDATVGGAERLVERVGQGDVRVHLFELGRDLHQMFRLMLPIMMMRWSNPDDELADMPCEDAPPLRLLGGLVAYLRGEIAEGRVADVDVEALARAFIGAIQNRVFFEVVLRARPESPRTSEAFVTALVDVLWAGCAPPSGKAARRPPSARSATSPGLTKGEGLLPTGGRRPSSRAAVRGRRRRGS
jgi:AcrR family transcriptional regulator